jgi:hypothetical protein
MSDLDTDWAVISAFMGSTKTARQCRHKWIVESRVVCEPSVGMPKSCSSWSKEEVKYVIGVQYIFVIIDCFQDEKLLSAVTSEKYQQFDYETNRYYTNWSDIAKLITGFNAFQCRMRYCELNSRKRNAKIGHWSPEEVLTFLLATYVQ